MTPAKRHAVVCAVTVTFALAVHWALFRWLADRDVMAHLIVGRGYDTALVVLAAMGTRAFLYLVAPGWMVFVLGRYGLSRLEPTAAHEKR